MSGANLSKSQKAALSKIPKGWHSESDLVRLGVDRPSRLALQSKSYLRVQNGESGKVFARVSV